MRIELHCHSQHSDGALLASAVANRALEREVSLFCLTDHDSCDGYPETLLAFPDAVRGLELSCTDNGRTVHLLMYQPARSTSWDIVEQALGEQKIARRERVYAIASRLAEMKVELDSERILRTIPGSIGRPHIAAELVRTGVVSSKPEAFDRFLKDGGPADVKVARLSLQDGLELGMAAGARMSLAHPHLYGKQAEELIVRHLPFGLTGLEVHYAKYKSARRRDFAQLAERHSLVQTGGSDFHEDGAGQPVIGIDVSDDVANRLLHWLERPRKQPN